MTIIGDLDSPTQPDMSRWVDLDQFRTGLYSCMTRRADALFELVDAMLCTPGRVTDLARLSLEPVHRLRSRGAL